MDSGIIVAIITSLATIITVVITSISNASKTKTQVDYLTTEIKGLSDKVEKHNSFDRRIVALETEVKIMRDDGR